MRAQILAVLIALSPTLSHAQAFRFDPDEIVLATNTVRRTTTYYRNGRTTQDYFPTKIFLYKPRNGYGYFYYAPSLAPTLIDEQSQTGNGRSAEAKELPPKVVGWKFQILMPADNNAS